MLISKFGNNDDLSNVESFEAKYNIKLPEQYRTFLSRYNGGFTPETTFKIRKVSSDIKGFYGIGVNVENLDFSFLEKIHVLKEYLEVGFLPIGTNSFGDYILIGLNDSNHGKVFFTYHDRPKGYTEISVDFEHFVTECKSLTIKPARSIEERRASMIAKGRESAITSQLIEIWQEEIDEKSSIKQEIVKLS
ncbi:MAG: SMI1/KNR4 family protein [Erysipelothrix sp.]